MMAAPELLEIDDARLRHDMAGVSRMPSFEQEAATWRIKRADLESRPSRRCGLSVKAGELKA